LNPLVPDLNVFEKSIRTEALSLTVSDAGCSSDVFFSLWPRSKFVI
jgi:hypothetical protein